MPDNSPVIDTQFQKLLMPLSDETYAELRQNIRESGCRDPIVLWGRVVLDGHNRLRICNELGVGYRTVQIDLPDKAAAKEWIIANQLARRNLSPEQIAYLRGVDSEACCDVSPELTSAGQIDRTDELHKNKISPSAAALAKKHGVSPATITRDVAFSRAVDSLPDEGAKAVKAGKHRGTKGKLEKAGRIADPAKRAQAAVEAIKESDIPDFSEPETIPDFDPPTDCLGQEIKDPKVAAVFASTEKLRAIVRAINAAIKMIRDTARELKAAKIDPEEIIKDLANGRRILEFGLPYAIYPEGYFFDADEEVRSKGFLTMRQYKALPKEFQADVNAV